MKFDTCKGTEDFEQFDIEHQTLPARSLLMWTDVAKCFMKVLLKSCN